MYSSKFTNTNESKKYNSDIQIIKKDLNSYYRNIRLTDIVKEDKNIVSYIKNKYKNLK